MSPGQRLKDRRVQKTQALLHEALALLLRQKNYDSISIKEILDRANVGRSTFYMHFRDKDDLLVSGMRDMLRAVRSNGTQVSATGYERIIRFSLPIFEHIHQHRRAGRAMMGTRGRAIVHEFLRKVLVDMIEDAVRERIQSRRKSADWPAPELLAQYVASTFVLVLNWWVDSRSALAPRDADGVFRTLVLPTLAAVCS
jgi:AcrR family transcriptional regulator